METSREKEAVCGVGAADRGEVRTNGEVDDTTNGGEDPSLESACQFWPALLEADEPVERGEEVRRRLATRAVL